MDALNFMRSQGLGVAPLTLTPSQRDQFSRNVAAVFPRLSTAQQQQLGQLPLAFC